MIGSSLVITGTVSADEDLDILGTVKGQISAPAHCVQVSAGARVEADILARDITVLGRVNGRLMATEIVDIRATANVSGQIAGPRIALEDGGQISARLETRGVDAAVRVAQYRQQK